MPVSRSINVIFQEARIIDRSLSCYTYLVGFLTFLKFVVGSLFTLEPRNPALNPLHYSSCYVTFR